MDGPLAWVGQGSREVEPTKLPLPEFGAVSLLTESLGFYWLPQSGGHFVRVYHVPRMYLKLASADAAQMSTHRHFHLKLISVELEGNVRESPLEKARGPKNKDKLQVGWEGCLQDTRRGWSICYMWPRPCNGPAAAADSGASALTLLNARYSC